MKNKIDDIRITILDYVVWVLAIIIVSYIFSVVIGSYILGVGIQGIMYVIGHKYILLGTMLCTIILCCPVFYVAHLQYERSYVLRRLRGMRKAVDGNLENSHFITKKEMLTSGYRIYETKEELQNAEDGILLHFEEYKKGKLKSIFSPETIHTLILGTTGSGKTSSYIIPSIKALSITKTKPSFMFTDPKGELYEKTAQHLKEQGYEIKVLDFRHPERSLRWNPLAYAYEKYEKARYIIETTVSKPDGYYFNGQVYDIDSIEQAELAEEQRLEDEAFEEIQNIVHSLCPVNVKDPIWDNGARAFIQAVLLAMLEDSRDESCDMTIDKFCFYNVAKICNKTTNECKGLKEYFAYRPETSLAVQYSGMVLNAPDKQQGSYMSSVAEKLMIFNDRGICNMTSGKSEIDVKQMDEKPMAIFLVLPDEREGRHPLGSLFISETYKKLVEKAVNNGGTLKRKVYFMLDEYGNMPKIDGVASMFTVGRSRGIIQMPVIQSYSQLIEKYGVETAKTIFGNCNIEIFIGAKDDDTCEKFSKKLGNYTILSTNVTGQKRAFEHNYSESLKERPLMYPRELTLLNNKKDMGNIVAINQGYSPSLGKFTPYFESKIFENKISSIEMQKPRSLEEESVLYRHEERAKKIKTEIKEYQEYVAHSQEVEEITNVEEDTSNINLIQETLRKLEPFAKKIECEFTNDDKENLKIIEQIIVGLREERAISALNQVLKLKVQYEQIINVKNKEENY